MAEPKRVQRPISPFMIGPYYRPQLTSVTSILTRITGNAMLVSFLIGTWWMLAAATSQEYFDVVDGFVTSWFGDLIMFLSLWGLCYHFLAGIRHLIYDAGRGLDIPTAEKLGWACVGGSVILTILIAIIV
ncbi:succinate dehydrogenase, cytochrome b556 subunit [Frigidibacter sp. MR17.24]|uniref:succinate dehydrogenase, cytochrome b556 subunit n=1 Tax=Frigidibacter sp. MR17.24 TaxID=3127345 RepID=UPI003012ED83